MRKSRFYYLVWKKLKKTSTNLVLTVNMILKLMTIIKNWSLDLAPEMEEIGGKPEMQETVGKTETELKIALKIVNKEIARNRIIAHKIANRQIGKNRIIAAIMEALIKGGHLINLKILAEIV